MSLSINAIHPSMKGKTKRSAIQTLSSKIRLQVYSVQCPHCGHEQEFSWDFVGRPTATCPVCHSPFLPKPLSIVREDRAREQDYASGSPSGSYKSEKAFSGRHMFHKPEKLAELAAEQQERLFTDRSLEVSFDRAHALQEPCDLQVVLDDVRSAWNVGAVFRTADAAGWSSISLTGITPTPQNPGVAKTALGSDKWVPYTYHASVLSRLRTLSSQGTQLAALELCEDAECVFHVSHLPRSMALVIGNEITGVSPEALSQCTRRFKIPMHGRKGSLNVAVAFGVAGFQLANSWRQFHRI